MQMKWSEIIATIVDHCFGSRLEDLSNLSKIPKERLELFLKGEKPSEDERSSIATAIGFSLCEIDALMSIENNPEAYTAKIIAFRLELRLRV